MDYVSLPFTKTSCCFLSLLAFSRQLLMLFQTSLSFSFIGSHNTSSNCLHHEKVALLQLKLGFFIGRGEYNSSSKLDSWNQATDCCCWDGITCDEGTGHVIGLDLSERWVWIEGRIDSSLFKLGSLRKLNLSWNNFYPHPIPSGLSHLTNLTHLSLSSSHFTGQIPWEISRLTKLISLDLSSNSLKLKSPNITTLIGNLSNLQELFLDGVNISEERGGKWAQAIPIALPNLQRLSLCGCGLQGPIDSSLFQIPDLSQLSLDGNNLSSIVVSDFLGDSTALTSLTLRSCNLYGKIPSSIANLTHLEHLDLSSNNFIGTIPSSYGDKLKQLIYLNLADNSLEGSIPFSLFSHPSLITLVLYYNMFSGWLLDFPNVSTSVLEKIYLGHNKLHGPIPRPVFELTHLKFLSLSNNSFTGMIELQMFQNLKNLSTLDLSDNGLSFINNNDDTHVTSSLQIRSLRLRLCNIGEFPKMLQNLTHLDALDLSKNKIHGEIPSWIWKVGNGNLQLLNLSNNFLKSFESPMPDFSSSRLLIVDLNSNRLHGSLPVMPPQVYFADYSNNNFSFIMPSNLSFASIKFFFISGNNISGVIPSSICKAHSLEVLDLSNNHFSGNIPTCLGEIGNSLKILNLQKNAFTGPVPDSFKKECCLRTLDLNSNQLEGPIPRSLANCKTLGVLNLGNNHLNDTFPLWLENLSNLSILILRSNKFHGPIAHSHTKNPLFPFLQIFDISSNYFIGNVPPSFFLNWKLMAGEGDSNDKILRYHMHFDIDESFYQDSVTVRTKGLDLNVVKINTDLTLVDLSNNRFVGEISQSIYNLKLLRGLNFSHNDFNGTISASFENLALLESLDLSRNSLSGEIPWQLTKLTFLEVLNLSENHLSGSIPQSQQFLTFTNSSFIGNIGLCGPPLSTKCGDTEATPPSTINNFGLDGEREIDWKFAWIGFGVGFGFGIGVVFWIIAL